VATQLKTGFETAIRLPKGGYKVFRVRALNANGRVIGTSKTFGVPNAGSKPPGLPQAY